MTTSSELPFYILCSSSPISTTAPGAPSTTLGHPTIQYHFADDSPLALLPETSDEHVLVLDWDPTAPSEPIVRSISRTIAVTAVKVAEAPGAAAEDEVRNDKMFILETITPDDKAAAADLATLTRQSPQAILAQFKQRNVILRRALEHPSMQIQGESSPLPTV